ncbi:MAG TPA: sulfatase-like hydrolase/transferase [Pyrinomonadaceae bacterium]|nr:sulfatase-like hydrolase/transferase [Pyrinomonadaceae bacterium]
MSKTTKDGLVALSLANLCFMGAWVVLLNPRHYTYYHWKYHPGFLEYAALLIDVLLLAALFWGAATLARRTGNRILVWAVRWAFLLSLIIPLNDLRQQLFDPLARGRKSLVAALVLFSVFGLVVLAAAALKKWRLKIIRTAYVAVLILSPFAVVTLLQGAWLTYKYRDNAAHAADAPPAPRLNQKDAPRVVWIVFDELDQRVAFTGRAAGLELPELDRLRGQSLFATNAYPPSNQTLLSMPSLVTGKVALTAMPERPDELMIRYKGEQESVPFSAQPNVFADARAAGFDTALVGWYHPYCRVVGKSLTSCFWEPTVDEISPLRGQPTLLKSMSNWAARSLFRIPGTFRIFQPWYDSDRAEDHTLEQQHVMERATGVARDKGFGLTLLHFPVPHHPFIYDRSRGALSSRPDNTYEGNLVLTDRVLGELRREMEAAGLWEGTTVIVSSDHWWRSPPDGKIDRRVPFIVKLPGQQAGTTYDEEFNTVLTRGLIRAILGGDVTSPEDAAAWLDRNRPGAERPGG